MTNVMDETKKRALKSCGDLLVYIYSSPWAAEGVGGCAPVGERVPLVLRLAQRESDDVRRTTLRKGPSV